MSKISFEIMRIDVKEKGNYFVLVQFDETEFPSKLTRTTKFRTEIDYTTEFPDFQKNYFQFENVQLGNKLKFRIGLFSFNKVSVLTPAQKKTNSIPPKLLFDNSTLIGSGDILLDSSWLNKIRKNKFVESDIKLIHPEIRGKESGHIFFKISCKSQTLDNKIYEDNKEIEKAYYDPFEQNKEEISEKLKSVIALNEEKQMTLEKIMKKVNEASNQAKYAVREKERVLSTLKAAEEENNQLRKHLSKIQNYDELHIEVDLLSQSPQGIEIIEKKYAILLGQLAIQKQIRMEYENQYEEIKPVMSKIQIIKNRLDVLKSANKELKFNHKRHEDMLPLITTYEEKIKNNDKLINNYKNNITDIVDIRKKNSPLSLNEIQERIEIFEKERKKLEEKKLQLNLYLDVYFKKDEKRTKTYDELSDPFYRLIGTDPTMNKIIGESEVEVLAKNQKKIKELEEEAQELSKKITEFEQKEKEKKEKGIVIQPSLVMKRNNLKVQVDTEEKKAKFLLSEIDRNRAVFLNEKEGLKDKIAHYDEIIERELKYARLRKYEDDVSRNPYTAYYDS